MKKRIISVVMAAMLAASVTACGGSSSSAPATTAAAATEAAASEAAAPAEAASHDAIALTFATGGADTLPSYAAAIDVVSDIEAADPAIDINYMGARQLGDDAEILQQVMGGTVQIGGVGYSVFSTYCPYLEAIALPFVLNDYDKEKTALQTPEAQALFDKVEEELGVKVLASYDSGMRHLANNTRPINSLEDMKGLKLRVVPSDLLVNSFTALGCNPANVPYGDIYTSLQNKVIDGEEINVTSINSEKHYEVLKYFTEIGIYPFATIIFANADWFNSLPADVQATIQDAFVKGYDYNFDKYIAEAEEAGYKAMEDSGMEISVIEDKSAFQEAVAPYIEDYKEKDPAIKAFVEMAEGL
ncbi:MAG: TRAP transporter substrate-binding protein [Lachnospiraceae bacterium]|nr:TRAP transporter substrate-binding protein [Lachnospiraceae bacterium]